MKTGEVFSDEYDSANEMKIEERIRRLRQKEPFIQLNTQCPIY